MRSRFIAVLVSIYCTGFISQAQQVPLSGHYMFNRYEHNPAIGGLEYSLSATVFQRTQWTGLPGAPQTIGVNAHLPMYVWNGGVGMRIRSDRAGYQRHTLIDGSYNYVVDSRFGLLSLGGRIGFIHGAFDGEQYRTSSGEYEGGIQHNDPLLANETYSFFRPIWEAGMYYIYQRFEGGVSLSAFPSTRFGSENARFENRTHFSLYGQYLHAINDELDIQYSAMVQSDLVFTQLSTTVLAWYQKKYIGGVSLRGYRSSNLDALAFIGGLRLNKHISFMYSYEAALSDLGIHHQGTHEFTLRYNLAKEIGRVRPEKIIYNPRFL